MRPNNHPIEAIVMTLTKIIFFSLFQLYSAAVFSQVTLDIDESTKLKTWKLIQSNFELQLVQRLPDQTRGFFQGRGFTKQQANDIATQCVLQTIVKNTASNKTNPSLSVSLKDWRVKADGQLLGVKLKEDWAKQWTLIQDENQKVKKSAQIAFRWSTFPSEQTFEPGGDYNWGMISFGLKPGEKFDLHVFWKVGEQLNNEWIRGVECPMDL